MTVAGLGRFGGGIAVARWLVEQGAKVLVTDRDSAEKLRSSVDQLAGVPIEFILGEHRDSDFTSCDLLVVSPAIPPTQPHLRAAIAAGVPVTTEIALFAERCNATCVGVTGTKGKSTTTTLLHRMLAPGRRTWLGGNIGVSLLDKLHRIAADDIVVLELSSFMLHWLGHARWSPRLAVLTMIGRDHLDWHGSLDAYHHAKANLLRFQSAGDAVVFDPLHEHSAAIAATSRGTPLPIESQLRQPLNLKLPGPHNQRNAHLALRAAKFFGVDFHTAQRAVEDFPGLPHRLEVVHEHTGIRWVNDSIATIPEAAVAANHAFDAGRVIQIVGGYDKGLDMTAMCGELAKRCKHVFTIGTLGPSLAELIGPSATHAGTLDHAARAAAAIAEPGDVILLSTGCASYDQFAHFEQRGQAFAALARDIGS